MCLPGSNSPHNWIIVGGSKWLCLDPDPHGLFSARVAPFSLFQVIVFFSVFHRLYESRQFFYFFPSS